MEFQRRPDPSAGFRPARAAEQSAGQRRTHHRRARLAGSIASPASSTHCDRTNIQPVNQPGRVDPFGDQIDTPFHAITKINRAGFDYQGDYTERSWAHTTVGI